MIVGNRHLESGRKHLMLSALSHLYILFIININLLSIYECLGIPLNICLPKAFIIMETSMKFTSLNLVSFVTSV